MAGTPLRDGGSDVYISCGIWALVGCERSAPVTTAEALAANVTNELGVESSIRLLKNVTGLWLLEESRRWWEANGEASTARELVAAAEHVPGGRSVVDPDDPRFGPPGDLPVRIAAVCAESGQPVPASPAETTRVILDSLALAWRRTVATIERVSGRSAERIHLVGGGSAISLLRRLCASACERPVLAGPAGPPSSATPSSRPRRRASSPTWPRGADWSSRRSPSIRSRPSPVELRLIERIQPPMR